MLYATEGEHAWPYYRHLASARLADLPRSRQRDMVREREWRRARRALRAAMTADEG
eukprot:gene27684-21743_t